MSERQSISVRLTDSTLDAVEKLRLEATRLSGVEIHRASILEMLVRAGIEAKHKADDTKNNSPRSLQWLLERTEGVKSGDDQLVADGYAAPLTLSELVVEASISRPNPSEELQKRMGRRKELIERAHKSLAGGRRERQLARSVLDYFRSFLKPKPGSEP